MFRPTAIDTLKQRVYSLRLLAYFTRQWSMNESAMNFCNFLDNYLLASRARIMLNKGDTRYYTPWVYLHERRFLNTRRRPKPSSGWNSSLTQEQFDPAYNPEGGRLRLIPFGDRFSAEFIHNHEFIAKFRVDFIKTSLGNLEARLCDYTNSKCTVTIECKKSRRVFEKERHR